MNEMCYGFAEWMTGSRKAPDGLREAISGRCQGKVAVKVLHPLQEQCSFVAS